MIDDLIGTDTTVARYYGLYPAIVSKLTDDPDGLQRVQVQFPWLGDAGDAVRAWAQLLSSYAEDASGFQVIPEVGTEVVVAFEAGDLRRPYIVGAAWNGKEKMPHDPTTENNVREWRTRSGSRIVFDDTTGAEIVSIAVAGAPDGAVHKVIMDNAAGTITVQSSAGGRVKITAGGGIEVFANTTVDVTAASVTVNAATSTFNGMVICDTLIAKSGGVVSPSYTPGAGNIW